jgi:N-ethylmaleimide reductase
MRGQAKAELEASCGSDDNGARLLLEILETLVGVHGVDRVGICLSLDAQAPGHDALRHALNALPAQRVAYAHVAPAWRPGASVSDDVAPIPAEFVRSAFGGALILSGGYSSQLANSHIGAGIADAIAFGGPFIANPDLPRRLRSGLPLAFCEPASFYTGGAQGYVGQAA